MLNTATELGLDLNERRAEQEIMQLRKGFLTSYSFYQWMIKHYKTYMIENHGKTLPLWDQQQWA